MKSAAVICEFNPLHKGHKFLINSMRQSGITHIVGIMSGNFVQRGDCAVMNKFRRAECAIRNGVDMVVELPVTRVLSSAEGFADGGVALAGALGCDELWFGSESNDIDVLRKLIEIQNDKNVKKYMEQELKKGVSTAKALGSSVAFLYGEKLSNILMSPNNILGIEYLKALDRQKSRVVPKTIKRIAVQHDSMTVSNGFASASCIRSNIENDNLKACAGFMDAYSYRILSNEIEKKYAPANIKNGERAILAVLRNMTREDFAMIADVNEGLENRIFEAVQNLCTLEEITSYIKSKRYTLARVRRIIMCSYLGITKSLQKKPISYIRPLCFNNQGTRFLSKNTKLPIITSTTRSADILSDDASELLQLEIKASELWGLLTPNIYPCMSDRRNFLKK